MLDRFFHETLHINSYALVINYLGCSEDRIKYLGILKKFMNSEQAQQVCDQCKERKDHNIFRIFDCKNIDCQIIYRSAPHMTDNLCGDCAQEWQQLQQQLIPSPQPLQLFPTPTPPPNPPTNPPTPPNPNPNLSRLQLLVLQL